VLERVQPLPFRRATEVTYSGPVGNGQIVKQLNNSVLFQNVLTMAEAYGIATSAGMVGALIFDALSKGSADSFALGNHGRKAILSDNDPSRRFRRSTR
jgi:3-hydroxyisobutyrate dehydrogenase-like beta-hydroxyacid dehydrogenase